MAPGAGRISPVRFGADPTGRTDSTAAFRKTLEVLLNTSAVAVSRMASGIYDLGGATLDLEGGEYLISQPIVIPPFVGNVLITDGTLRAGPGFDPERFLVEVGNVTCKPDSQASCNEFVSTHPLFTRAANAGM